MDTNAGAQKRKSDDLSDTAAIAAMDKEAAKNEVATRTEERANTNQKSLMQSHTAISGPGLSAQTIMDMVAKFFKVLPPCIKILGEISDPFTLISPYQSWNNAKIKKYLQGQGTMRKAILANDGDCLVMVYHTDRIFDILDEDLLTLQRLHQVIHVIVITEIPVIALPTKAYYKWCAPSCFVPGDPGKAEESYADFVHNGVGVINSVNVKIQPGERPFDIERGCFVTTLHSHKDKSSFSNDAPYETFTISGVKPIEMTVHNEMEYLF